MKCQLWSGENIGLYDTDMFTGIDMSSILFVCLRHSFSVQP